MSQVVGSRRRRSVRRGETGTSLPRMLAFLVVALAVGYVAIKVVPVVAASFRFAEAMRQEVSYGPVGESEALIRGRLRDAAIELELPLRTEDIVVTRRGDRITAEAHYVIPVEFLGAFVWSLEFNPHYEGTRRPPAFRES